MTKTFHQEPGFPLPIKMGETAGNPPPQGEENDWLESAAWLAGQLQAGTVDPADLPPALQDAIEGPDTDFGDGSTGTASAPY
jgi:hypothetical protein